jgi:hypothetical protein
MLPLFFLLLFLLSLLLLLFLLSLLLLLLLALQVRHALRERQGVRKVDGRPTRHAHKRHRDAQQQQACDHL